MSHLQPFRELLKKKTQWYWDRLLQKSFKQSREHISMRVVEGIKLFDKTRWTAVSTDWSKMGVGYFMSQKYCSCLEITPTCCAEGWKVCMVGSSFNSPAASNYAPIEGECLRVASALTKRQGTTPRAVTSSWSARIISRCWVCSMTEVWSLLTTHGYCA